MNDLAQGWRSWVLREPTVLTLGNFDGVHLGHHRILMRLLEMAQEKNLKATVITFEPHPKHLFHPDDRFSRLTSPEEKAALLRNFGVDIVTLRFDTELAQLPAEEFIREFLAQRVQGKAFLLGHDHRFGAGARGNAAMLRALLPEAWVEESKPFAVDTDVVSSSLIRAHLEQGRPEAAEKLLGRPFQYAGKVVAGAGRARQLKVPTANVDLGCPEKIQVAAGVYFGRAHCEGQTWPALANIGFAPTFGEGTHKIEVHIPFFSGSLYDRWLEFDVLQFHRAERSFDGAEALKTQIQADLKAFEAYFSGGNPRTKSGTKRH